MIRVSTLVPVARQSIRLVTTAVVLTGVKTQVTMDG